MFLSLLHSVQMCVPLWAISMCMVTIKVGQEDHPWITAEGRREASLMDLLHIGVGNHSRVDNRVYSFVKEAWIYEILETIDYEEHCIRGYLAQHHFIDYERIKRGQILSVKHHFEMLLLK